MLALLGWLLAAGVSVVALRLRRRLELVAQAEHELRGPLTAFALALDAARGTAVGRRLALTLDAELARARGGLMDLSAARLGRRAASAPAAIDVNRLVRSSAAAWGARVRGGGGSFVVHADRSRVAQALGNVLANAREHGVGEVSVRAHRLPDGVRIEVTNAVRPAVSDPGPGRGLGLGIAARAAEEAGGTLRTAIDDERATAVLELPIEQ